jgi:hypothetical protein
MFPSTRCPSRSLAHGSTVFVRFDHAPKGPIAFQDAFFSRHPGAHSVMELFEGLPNVAFLARPAKMPSRAGCGNRAKSDFISFSLI